MRSTDGLSAGVGMMSRQWEYRVLYFTTSKQGGNIRVDGPDTRDKALSTFLCAEGREGWELVQVWVDPVTGKTAMIFKRPHVGMDPREGLEKGDQGLKRDPALPNLNSEEQAELELLRERETELLTTTRAEETLRAKDEFQRMRARIKELYGKGRVRTIKG